MAKIEGQFVEELIEFTNGDGVANSQIIQVPLHDIWEDYETEKSNRINAFLESLNAGGE